MDHAVAVVGRLDRAAAVRCLATAAAGPRHHRAVAARCYGQGALAGLAAGHGRGRQRHRLFQGSEIHRSHGAQGLLRTGLLPPGVGALHDPRRRRHAPRRRRERRRSQSQADLGRGLADQGRRARQRLCRRRAGAADRASGHQPRPAQHRHVEPGAGEVSACRRRRRDHGGGAGSEEHSRTRGPDGLRSGAATRLADVRRAPGRRSLRSALRGTAPPRLHPPRRARVRRAVRHVSGAAHGGPHPGAASRGRTYRQRRSFAAHLDQDRRRAGRARRSVQRDGRAAGGILCGTGGEGGGSHARAGPVGRRADRAWRGHPGGQLDARSRNAALHHRRQGRRALRHGRRRRLGAGPGNRSNCICARPTE